MKFLHLKEALDKALPQPDPPAPKTPPEPLTIPFYSPGEKRQQVVGGDVIRKPIDRTAALVVSQAPWWAKPPDTPAPPIPKALIPQTVKHTIKRKKDMSNPTKVVTHPAQPAAGQQYEKKDNDVFNVEIATEAIKRTADSLTGIRKLVDEAMDARAALDILCDYWKKEWMDFMEQSDQRLRELRMARMAFEVETKVLMASLKDIRQFFLDKNYEDEMKRMKDFVAVCYQMQELKKSGFVDTIADTLIKLSEGK